MTERFKRPLEEPLFVDSPKRSRIAIPESQPETELPYFSLPYDTDLEAEYERPKASFCDGFSSTLPPKEQTYVSLPSQENWNDRSYFSTADHRRMQSQCNY